MNKEQNLIPLSAMEEVLDALEATIWQDCLTPDDTVDSRFVTVHAYAIRVLAKYGRVNITSDDGGRLVEGVFTNKQAW